MRALLLFLLCSLAIAGNAQLTEDETDPSIEVVIVRATKRAENLQEVPVAISAMTSTDLEIRGIIETSDLMGSSPNLQVTSAYAQTQPNFSVRGVGVANEFSAATASPIGVYVDEVYQTFRAGHGQQLYDLEQIEVLRGPQGTLFGKNTTGGAVLLTTRQPGLNGQDGYLTAGAGNYSSRHLEGAYENNITSSLGYRVAGTMREADGYTRNTIDDQYYGETDSYAARFSLLWEPTANLQGRFKSYVADNDALGDLPYGIGYLDGGRNILALDLATGTINTAVPGLRDGLAQDEIASDSGNGYSTNSHGAAMTWRYSRDELAFTSITGYDNNKYRLAPFDCDGSPVDLCAIRYSSESSTVSQDMRVEFGSESVQAIAGAYIAREDVYTANEPDFFGFLDDILGNFGFPPSYFNPPILSEDALGIVSDGTAACGAVVINPTGFYDSRSFLDAPNCQGLAPPFSSALGDQRFTIERPTEAIYAEVNWEITDRLALTAGARFTQDEVNYRDARTILFSPDGVARASTVPYSFPYDPDMPKINRNEDSEEWTGRVILDYQLSDDVMIYASYSSGYRAGTYNNLAYQDIDQVYFLEPELVDAFEIGFKSRFLNDRLQINGALFSYDYKKQQITEIVGLTSFLRAVDGEISGGELELVARVSDRLTWSAGYGFLDSEYDYGQVLFGGGASLDIGGNDFANAPDQTFSTTMDWQVASFVQGTLNFSLNAQYMGEYFFDPFGDYNGQYVGSPALAGFPQASRELALGNPSYWLADAQISFEGRKLAVTAWARNLTDEFYYIYGLNLNSLFEDYFTRGLPRSYGLQLTYFLR